MTITRSGSGLYSVRWFTDFSVWLQWRCWNFQALNRTFCPEVLTVSLASPPELAEGVELVVAEMKKMREEIDKERGPKSHFAWPSIPASPAPFVPWTQGFSNDIAGLERARREIDGKSFQMAPAYAYEANAIFRQLEQRVSSKSLQKKPENGEKLADTAPLAF